MIKHLHSYGSVLFQDESDHIHMAWEITERFDEHEELDESKYKISFWKNSYLPFQ